MGRRSDQRPWRICRICLYRRVLKGDPVAMVRCRARHVKCKGLEMLKSVIFKEESLETCFGGVLEDGGMIKARRTKPKRPSHFR
jgi:hypothetical protein